ncbi:hypothetical protein FDB29_15510 [Clostridium botulinum]|nr:hypothetical protein [Clostridium botulinum]
MNWLTNKICTQLAKGAESTAKTVFGKIISNIKFLLIKRKINLCLRNKILNLYQNEPFYNKLDAFLARNKVFDELIENNNNIHIHKYKGLKIYIKYYSKLFQEQYDNDNYCISEIKKVIEVYFCVIFDIMNDYKNDNTAKSVINNIKEAQSDITDDIKKLNYKLEEKIDIIIGELKNNKNVPNSTVVCIKNVKELLISYLECVQSYYLNNKNNNIYVERTVYTNESDSEDSLSALLNNKRILLQGEAGCGKSFEAQYLAYLISSDERAEKIIPVYFPLIEYGKLYKNIKEGISKKIEAYLGEDTSNIVIDILKNGRFAIILDGIDDIADDKEREKCITDIKDLFTYSGENYYFITIRGNRYNNEFGYIKKYSLNGFTVQQIRNVLFDRGINRVLTDNYYELFSNPLLLRIGINVFERNPNSNILNRSNLFEEFIKYCYNSWNLEKGVVVNKKLSYIETLNILSKIAYKKFSDTCFNYIEFEKMVSEISGNLELRTVINELICLDIFKVSDSVSFVHKTFKEFLAAYYLVNNYTIKNNLDIYTKLIHKNEFKEVFIFAAGMFNTVEEEDQYLDFILERDLKLYVECVDAKNDLSEKMIIMPKEDYIKRYFNILLKSYTSIIHNYFEPIQNMFDPALGSREKNNKSTKVAVRGTISEDREHISYIFDRVEIDKPSVLNLRLEEMKEYRKDREMRAIEYGRVIKSSIVNLKLSDLLGDSCRQVALRKIKGELNNILEKRMLIESDWLLCERVLVWCNKIKALKQCSDIHSMYTYIRTEIERNYNLIDDPNTLVSIEVGGVNILKIEPLLKYLDNKNIKLQDYILPREDLLLSNGHSFIWDLFSKEQKEKRISKFFYWHQLSYMQMAKSNFPRICNSFRRFEDIPYKTMVYVNLKENHVDNINSEPHMIYYDVAASVDTKELVEITYVNDDKIHKQWGNYSQIDRIIEDSYKKLGKKANHTNIVQTEFTHTVISRKMDGKLPLTECVYDSLKEDIENMLGKI